MLDERGWDVTIVEAATGPRTGGYMIDFFVPGWEAAARLGAIDEIRRRGHDYRRLVTRDASGRVSAKIDLDVVRAPARGRFTSILREDVELSLRAGLPARIDQRFGVSVAELTRRPSGVEATLTDGTGIEADLVLGCDGLSSGLRSLLFGPANEFVLDLGYRVGGGHFHAPGIGGRLGGDVFLSDVKGEQFGCTRSATTGSPASPWDAPRGGCPRTRPPGSRGSRAATARSPTLWPRRRSRPPTSTGWPSRSCRAGASEERC